MVHKGCAQHDPSDFAAGTRWAGVCSKESLQSHSQPILTRALGTNSFYFPSDTRPYVGFLLLTCLLGALVYKQGISLFSSQLKSTGPSFCELLGSMVAGASNTSGMVSHHLSGKSTDKKNLLTSVLLLKSFC